MKEIWKKVKIKGFSHYSISNHGRLKNRRTNNYPSGYKIPSTLRGNFIQYNLKNSYASRSIFAHLLVFSHFKVNQIKGRAIVWHNDWNGTNNTDTNLNEITWGDLKRKAFEKKKQERGIYKWSDGTKARDQYRASLKVNDKVVTLGYAKRKTDAKVLYEFAYNFIYGSMPY